MAFRAGQVAALSVRYRTQFIIPVAVLVAVSLACLTVTLCWLTIIQDEIAHNRERDLVQNAYKSILNINREQIKGYAYWDDAVRNMILSRNTEWLNDNVGPYLFKLHGYEYTFVIDGKDRTIYASEGARQSSLQALTALGAPFNRALAEMRMPGTSTSHQIVGLTKIGRQLATFSIAGIRPNPGRVALPPGPAHYLVIVKLLDGKFLDETLTAYRIRGVRIENQAAVESGAAAIPINLYNGQAAGALVWDPDLPGSRLRALALPWLVLVGIFICGLAAIATRFARIATRDLSESEMRARHLANHDSLTNLPNRRAFSEKLRDHDVNSAPIAVIYVDLDGFKEINDVHGHLAGDVLLKAATDRLASLVAWRGVIARIGGDEFAIIIEGTAHSETAEVLARAIVAAFDEPFVSSSNSLMIGASVGIACSANGINGNEVARRADIAMYAAKADGKRRMRAYHPRMEEGRDAHLRIERELHAAIGTGQIRVVYQPIVCARSERIVGVEALARWCSPTLGDVGPDIFIPIAEGSGLIAALGKQILREACSQTRDWSVDLSVNLSPAQFWDESLFNDIIYILEETGFPAERLELEITEGYLLRRPEAAASIFGRLQKLGIRVALDDFGAGYASVGYLRRFNLDGLKIDRSLVESVIHDHEAADVVNAIVALGKALGLSITAEGIEHRSQADMLSIAGCRHLQGWLFGRPASAAETLARLQSERVSKDAPAPASVSESNQA